MLKPAVGVVLLQSVASQHKLGDKTVLSLVLAQLRNVRGLDKIVGVTNETLQHHYDPKDFDKYLVVKQEPTTAKKDQFLLNITGAEQLLVCLPHYPLLQTGKLEKLLNLVRRGKASKGQLVRQYGRLKVPIDDVYSLTVSPEARIETVTASLTEALDVSRHDEYCLIAAYLQYVKNNP